MTPNQRKEEISRAYVHAIAGACGFAVGAWSQDHACIDTTISGPSPKKAKLDLQLKATSQGSAVKADHISWQVSRAHYEQMACVEVSAPHYLVVLVLPEDAERSVEHTVEQLAVRRCAYWIKMTGMPPVAVDSPTVQIPKAQVFSPEALAAAMTAAERGDHLAWAAEVQDEA